LKLDPNDANNTGNFAQFLGARGRLDEAYHLAIRAWQLLDKVPSSNHADIAFTRWLLDRASGRDGTPALGRLKTALQTSFIRGTWSFDELLTTLGRDLAQDEQALAHKIADALLDASNVEALETESIWGTVDGIPLDAPWLG
jgi:hypothetical protein